MSKRYVKLWESSLDSEVFQVPSLWKVWTWALLSAAWRDHWTTVTTGRGQTPVFLSRGQLIFSRYASATALHMTPSTVRNCLSRLETMGNVDTQTKAHYTVVTICHYETYQSLKPGPETPLEDTQRTPKPTPKPKKRTPKHYNVGKSMRGHPKDTQTPKSGHNIRNRRKKKPPPPAQKPGVRGTPRGASGGGGGGGDKRGKNGKEKDEREAAETLLTERGVMKRTSENLSTDFPLDRIREHCRQYDKVLEGHGKVGPGLLVRQIETGGAWEIPKTRGTPTHRRVFSLYRCETCGGESVGQGVLDVRRCPDSKCKGRALKVGDVDEKDVRMIPEGEA